MLPDHFHARGWPCPGTFLLAGDLQVLESPRKDLKDKSEWEQGKFYSGRESGSGQGAGATVRETESARPSGRGPARKCAAPALALDASYFFTEVSGPDRQAREFHFPSRPSSLTCFYFKKKKKKMHMIYCKIPLTLLIESLFFPPPLQQSTRSLLFTSLFSPTSSVPPPPALHW